MAAKILLVSLNDGFVPVGSYSALEHIGLAYLAASLRRAGHTVAILDCYALNLTIDEALARTRRFAPDMIGVTAEYNTFPAACEYTRRAKRELPESPWVCMGGEHATYASEEILRDEPQIDGVGRGEGDLTIVELADRLAARVDLTRVAGVWARDDDGSIVRNPGRPRVADLDSLPFPARDTLEECLRSGIQPAFSILSSRGCQFNCSFCNANRFFRSGGGRAWQSRSGRNVAAELTELVTKYGSSNVYPVVYFFDENFIGPGRHGIERAEDIARAILDADLKIAFEIFCRADSFNGHEDTVILLKQAGLTSALVGLESGVQNSLDVIDKHTTVDENLSTLSLFQKHNVITSSSGFIMFNPYSAPDELVNNARFLLKIGHATLYNMSLRVLMYPGIKLTERMHEDGLVEPDATHFRVDRYRFVDSRVAQVATAIDSVDLELIKEEDATLRHMDMTIARIKDSLQQNGQSSSRNEKRVSALLGPSMQAKQALNRTAFDFFSDVVQLACVGWAEERFGERKELYLAERKARLDGLNQSFRAFLEEICGEPAVA